MDPEDLVEEAVGIRGRELRLLRPRDAEALLDEEAFEREEFLPYWAELWPSALALARAVGARSLGARRVVELGCGLGLPSIAAALQGARVLATDWSPDAVAVAADNAARNGAAIDTLVCSWAEPEPIARRGPWDLVLASDVLYEQRDVDLLLAALPPLLAGGGEAWIADPGRAPAERFLECAAATFDVRTTMADEVPRGGIHRLRLHAPPTGTRHTGGR
jgi:predicted nicotinamide N-methyase